MFVAKVIVLLTLVELVTCYQSYQLAIPNGAKVPHPCQLNTIWGAVGHLNPQGGGDLNPFGEDFKAAGQARPPLL